MHEYSSMIYLGKDNSNHLQVAQVGIALIGLCYSPDTVTNTALVSNGTVLVPDMSQVFPEAHSYDAKSDTVSDQQYTANK
jgi:hypothetical protein